MASGPQQFDAAENDPVNLWIHPAVVIKEV